VLDAVSGTVELGPSVREPDGTLRHYGRVPQRGAVVRLRAYRTGGGAGGNVRALSLEVLRSSIPYVSRVGNRVAARGGRAAEDVENAKVRGPLQLRGTHRAVTCEDYEQVAGAAAPELARVKCVPDEDGAVRVLLVPATGDGFSRRPFEDLQPSEDSLRRVSAALDERRVIGARVAVEPPAYRGLTVVAHLRALPGHAKETVLEAALEALYRHHDPVYGGVDGRGWEFGRSVQYGEVFAVLQRVRGVDIVEDVRLFPADPVTGRRGEAARTITLEPTALAFGYDHQVKVTPCED
jgi:predicted phage baseplate assembly protein